ncbi:hypothetical protein ASPCAL06806 [Aspergillus calidoustus]|uniref:Xylanolytic transcriptional activator regulatory domain-containing protein n=1 Tax=Aspergillus calidoustus TaxID=454130 RepID=A0A0U5C9L0_ASPCI|nr:hypothetical protein ASPCAL06806 [Aspergillus calidoustus]
MYGMTRKVRCSMDETGTCKRCQARNLACSYVHRVSGFDHGTTTSPTHQDPAPPVPDTGVLSALQLSSSNSGLDIGTGTASEILREGELTQTLLLLYFQNFHDIHSMFDQTIFLRRFALGDIPKVLLFAIMALGIRYSHAPFQNPHLRPHWGESLYQEARQLLKEDFDHPSLTTIQVYVLLATYNLTFGGARKAWMFLSFARSFVAILRLDKPASDLDPVQAELCRRLIATIILMENTFPPYLDLRGPCLLPALYRSCNQQFAPLQQQLSDWNTNLHPSLALTQANLETHQQKFTLRSFMYMHLLYEYIWQLILFDSLDWTESTLSGTSDTGNGATLLIYKHASATASIVQQVWFLAHLDLHNACFGQMVKTAQVILTHWLLTATDPRVITGIQSQLLALRDCLTRVKAHCRLFNWVFDQAEWFLRVVNQADFKFYQDSQRWKSMLKFQVMSLGTSYERLDYETAGRSSGLESLADAESLEQHRKDQIPTILTPSYIAQKRLRARES